MLIVTNPNLVVCDKTNKFLVRRVEQRERGSGAVASADELSGSCRAHSPGGGSVGWSRERPDVAQSNR